LFKFFSLLPVVNQDVVVKQMYAFLRSRSWKQKRLAAKPWYENPEIINDIKSRAIIVRGFVKEKENETPSSSSPTFTGVRTRKLLRFIRMKMVMLQILSLQVNLKSLMQRRRVTLVLL